MEHPGRGPLGCLPLPAYLLIPPFPPLAGAAGSCGAPGSSPHGGLPLPPAPAQLPGRRHPLLRHLLPLLPAPPHPRCGLRPCPSLFLSSPSIHRAGIMLFSLVCTYLADSYCPTFGHMRYGSYGPHSKQGVLHSQTCASLNHNVAASHMRMLRLR